MHPIRRHYAVTAVAALATAASLAGCGPKGQVETSPCDLNHGACPFALATGETGRIELTPRPLPLMKPIEIRVDAPAPVRTARLDFQGTTMDMGFNQATLRGDATGQLAGIAMLPVCATGAMRWRADLYLDGSAAPAARFEFESGDPGR